MTLMKREAAVLIVSNRFLRTVVLYHLILFFLFLFIYTTLVRFESHFDLRYGDEDATVSTIAYYVLHTQSTVMTGDVQPKTRLGRALQSSHVILSWIIIILAMTPLNE